jgi:hypothetical protein
MPNIVFYTACEGLPDAAVIRRIVQYCNHDMLEPIIAKGKSDLDQRLRKYNIASAHEYWFIVRDLDNDKPCAPDLVSDLLPARMPKMKLRVAVRSIESWLMADRISFSTYFAVPRNKVPYNPETIESPKQFMLNLIARSRRQDIKEDMLPRVGSLRREGPAYAGRLADFASRQWDIGRAALNSRSLARAVACLGAIG